MAAIHRSSLESKCNGRAGHGRNSHSTSNTGAAHRHCRYPPLSICLRVRVWMFVHAHLCFIGLQCGEGQNAKDSKKTIDVSPRSCSIRLARIGMGRHRLARGMPSTLPLTKHSGATAVGFVAPAGLLVMTVFSQTSDINEGKNENEEAFSACCSPALLGWLGSTPPPHTHPPATHRDYMATVTYQERRDSLFHLHSTRCILHNEILCPCCRIRHFHPVFCKLPLQAWHARLLYAQYS